MQRQRLGQPQQSKFSATKETNAKDWDLRAVVGAATPRLAHTPSLSGMFTEVQGAAQKVGAWVLGGVGPKPVTTY